MILKYILKCNIKNNIFFLVLRHRVVQLGSFRRGRHFEGAGQAQRGGDDPAGVHRPFREDAQAGGDHAVFRRQHDLLVLHEQEGQGGANERQVCLTLC